MLPVPGGGVAQALIAARSNTKDARELSAILSALERVASPEARDYLQQVAIYVLRDADGVAQAFANDLPSYKPGVATIDLMRHRADAPANSIDMLFTQLFLRCQQQGYSSFNLGLSPLDGQPFITGFAARSLMFIYRISDSFIGFRGLHQFKSKYEPQWEPRYVWFQGGTLSLQPIGVAVVKLLTGS